MSERLSTGVAVIDRHMHGGIPRGSLLAVSAPPESQSELLLAAASSVADTHYLTAGRTADAVTASLDRPTRPSFTVEEVSPESLATDSDVLADAVPDGGYLVVDAFDEIEALDDDVHRATLRQLSTRLRELESVGILHCAQQESRTAARRRTLQYADVVWRLHLVVTTLSVDTRLVISKVRRGRPHLEPVKLKLTDQVLVDTSRDIA